MKNSARLFNCIRCYSQRVICSHCDRGNIYCGPTCSQHARAQKHRIANQKYQKSLQGRRKHAERQKRYRQRQKNKVTDQGSPILPPNDLLPHEPNEHKTQQTESMHCHFCGKVVSSFLRNGYLCHYTHDQMHRYSCWPLAP